MEVESADASSVAQNWSNAASGIIMLNLSSEFSSCAFEMMVLPMFLPCCSRVCHAESVHGQTSKLSHKDRCSSAGGRAGCRTRDGSSTARIFYHWSPIRL